MARERETVLSREFRASRAASIVTAHQPARIEQMTFALRAFFDVLARRFGE